jgi:hypothetical protein
VEVFNAYEIHFLRIDMIEATSRSPMVVQQICTSCLEGFDPFINTPKYVNILLKGSQKPGVNFDGIYAFTPENVHHHALLEFRVDEEINVC